MGAGGSNPDFEQVEGADEHGISHSFQYHVYIGVLQGEAEQAQTRLLVIPSTSAEFILSEAEGLIINSVEGYLFPFSRDETFVPYTSTPLSVTILQT